MQYFNRVFIDGKSMFLNCCNPATAGNSEFKGSYNLPAVLAGNINDQDCEYSGKTTAVKAFATCQTNMKVGPSYIHFLQGKA